MKRKKRIRAAALALALVALVFSGVASAHAPKTITIHHQMRGCHAWAIGNGPYRTSLRVTADLDATFRFVNDDVMPQKLVQVAGPKTAIAKANMNHIGAVAILMFPGKGVYRFTTKPGEDYRGMAMRTIGKDNVLRLTVVVR